MDTPEKITVDDVYGCIYKAYLDGVYSFKEYQEKRLVCVAFENLVNEIKQGRLDL